MNCQQFFRASCQRRGKRVGVGAAGETYRRVGVGRVGVRFPIVIVLVIVFPFNWH